MENNKIENLCDYCGYLIKDYSSKNKGEYIACCGKCWENGLPKIISRTIKSGEKVCPPFWCHKLVGDKKKGELVATSSPQQPQTNSSSTETKRDKIGRLPTHLKWDDIEEGTTYVIPPIMNQKLRVVRVDSKTDYCIRCFALNSNMQADGSVYNIYKRDLDMIFIVKYHKH